MVRRSSRGPRSQIVTGQVRFEGGEEIPILFANHVFVRSGPDGFLVSFAQSHGPYDLNITTETLRNEGIAAKIVARLIVPPNRMRQFAEIFNNVTEVLDAGIEGSDDDDKTNDTSDPE